MGAKHLPRLQTIDLSLFLGTLKMEIKILANLSNKLYAKLKIGKTHAIFEL